MPEGKRGIGGEADESNEEQKNMMEKVSEEKHQETEKGRGKRKMNTQEVEAEEHAEVK